MKNILPACLVQQVKEMYEQAVEQPRSGLLVLERIPEMSVLFSDIVGFTSFASARTAEVVMHMLNNHFKKMDTLCIKYKLEKIKTIGY